MCDYGFSTGCLYLSDFDLRKKIRIYHSAGAEAIELSFAYPKELRDCDFDGAGIDLLKSFKKVTIHAPWKGIRYDAQEESRKVIDKIGFLCESLPVSGIVLHPDTIDDFDFLIKQNLPWLLENMDSRKKYGISPPDIKELKDKCDFGFVLDLQHVFEHDPNMNLAREFQDVMGDRLAHLHVSGCTEDQNHFPLHCANNKAAVIQALKNCPDVPIILEGKLLTDIQNTINKELAYIRTLL